MHRKNDLDAMFEAIDEEGRGFVMAVLRGEFERVRSLPRARLRVIDCQVRSDLPKDQIDPVPINGSR